MDLNLDTLKREIVEYLDSAGIAVFHSTSGGLEELPMVLWDTDRYPDYQLFIETARKVGAQMILFAAQEFSQDELDEALEQMEECELERDERMDLEGRLRDLRGHDGLTCSLELAFDHNGRMYVYEIRPDWYDEFLVIGEEINAHLPGGALTDGDDSLGGYFSKN